MTQSRKAIDTVIILRITDNASKKAFPTKTPQEIIATIADLYTYFKGKTVKFVFYHRNRPIFSLAKSARKRKLTKQEREQAFINLTAMIAAYKAGNLVKLNFEDETKDNNLRSKHHEQSARPAQCHA